MLVFLARRFALMLLTLFVVAVLIFLLVRVVPGDPVVVKLRAEGAAVSEETIEAERKRLGIDKPVLPLVCRRLLTGNCSFHADNQLSDYLSGLARLDLGKSLWTGAPVAKEIWGRLPVSIEIAILALVIAVVIAIPLGVISAVFRDTWIDYVVRVFAVSGIAIPGFWLGMLIILALLAVTGKLPQLTYISIFKDPVANLYQLIWPALSVGYRYAAVSTRMMRSTLLEVMQEDYIRTARAKGVLKGMVVRRHAMRNAMLPVITVIGLEFAFLLGGLVVTEQVFGINGIGKLFVDAVLRGDFNLIQGLVLLIAFISILSNFVVDLTYGLFDPRIRQS